MRGVHCTRITMSVIKTPWGELRTTLWTSELNFRVVSISERRGNERDCIVHLLKLHESTVEKVHALFINLFAISNFDTFVGFFFPKCACSPPFHHNNIRPFLSIFSGFPYRSGHHLWTSKDDVKEIVCFSKHFAQTDHEDQAGAQDFPDFSEKMLKRLCAQGFNSTSVWGLAIAGGGISIVIFYDKTRTAFEKEM